jgi:hypothetical protein
MRLIGHIPITPFHRTWPPSRRLAAISWVFGRRKNEDILIFNRRDVNPVSQSISRDGLQGRIDPVN